MTRGESHERSRTAVLAQLGAAIQLSSSHSLPHLRQRTFIRVVAHQLKARLGAAGAAHGAFAETLGRLLVACLSNLAKPLGNARLPTWTSCPPALDDVRWQTEGNELLGIGRARPPALVHYRAGQASLGQRRQLLVLVRPNCVSVDPGEVRFQSTARGALFHDRWPFAC